MNTKKEKIVYRIAFGMESCGKVVELQDGTFQCFETALFGGDWVKCGHPKPFKDKKEAIDYLKSLI